VKYFSYSSGGNDNTNYKETIKSYCDHFIDTRGEEILDFAHRVYNDGIDILIDLNGHTGTQDRKHLH